MKPSIPVDKKRSRGRPATGQDPAISVRLPQEVMDALMKEAGRQGVSKSEAARRLIERGLPKMVTVMVSKVER